MSELEGTLWVSKSSNVLRVAFEEFLLLQYGWYANPIVHGDYPEVMKEHLARRSKAAGYKKSLLPEFSESVSKEVKGTTDFLGVNIYTAVLARGIHYTTDTCDWQSSMEVEGYVPSSWNSTSLDWYKVSSLIATYASKLMC